MNENNNTLCFDEEKHKYTFNDIEFISTTTFLSQFFNKFDENEVVDKILLSENYKQPKSKYYLKTKEEIIKEWKDLGSTSAKLGTDLHKRIEDYLLKNDDQFKDTDYLNKEFSYFLNFLEDQKEINVINKENSFIEISKRNPLSVETKSLSSPDIEEFVASEIRVFDLDSKIAGTIDGLFKNKDGYIIYDWKRTKEIKYSNFFAKAKEPINEFDDCNFIKYSLQLNTYKYILEKNYNIKIIGMYLVILHPNEVNYKKIKIEDMSDKVNKLINYMNNKN